ncbi:prepilin-type N-terminal cleavage/methylation domain-containing protein [Cerasicoccus frondis]|uniref:prepilin-type N-terminal cleavage/methylation domain-containing protein n=1 Tax=Cerasicoccus frondis TaxID=490090 RepID=UPI002852CE15|nr:prepilin-type N-terminal cleavage/methylation domain-containing protein [Cerasicoccus frondis]
MTFRSTNSRKHGFSLVELLAVIAIIAVMAAIIGVSLPDNSSANLKSGQSAAIGMFQAARTVASMRRTEARVIIYADSDTSEPDAEKKFLRYMGVVYWGDPDEDGTYDWVAANSGVYLPAGVYYIPDGSVPGLVSAEGDASNGEILTSSDIPAVMQASFPVSTGDENDWYYYSFDGSGSARTDSNVPGSFHNFAGEAVVFAAGRVEPSGTSLQVLIKNPFLTNGFVIRRFGGVLNMEEYDQVQSATN